VGCSELRGKSPGPVFQHVPLSATEYQVVVFGLGNPAGGVQGVLSSITEYSNRPAKLDILSIVYH